MNANRIHRIECVIGKFPITFGNSFAYMHRYLVRELAEAIYDELFSKKNAPTNTKE